MGFAFGLHPQCSSSGRHAASATVQLREIHAVGMKARGADRGEILLRLSDNIDAAVVAHAVNHDGDGTRRPKPRPRISASRFNPFPTCSDPAIYWLRQTPLGRDLPDYRHRLPTTVARLAFDADPRPDRVPWIAFFIFIGLFQQSDILSSGHFADRRPSTGNHRPPATCQRRERFLANARHRGCPCFAFALSSFRVGCRCSARVKRGILSSRGTA